MNKAIENLNSFSQFLGKDGGKTKSNAIEIPSIFLPKGGGSIKGIDEKFSVNAVNGTATFSVPLPFSPARGASPALSLFYNSGYGNGIFGIGWALRLPGIKRKTDKRLPRYLDEIDSDTFLFSEAEDLVPEFKKEPDGSFSKDIDGNYIIKEQDSADGMFTIRFYKPRIEGLFARIERWSSKVSQEIKWRVITKENVTTLFGWSDASRIADPDDANKIYEWLPEFVFDDKGNCSQYLYRKEDGAGIDDTLIHNRNRLDSGNITYTNLYLEKVIYGNKTPYKHFNDPFPPVTDYFFQTVFDYGEYNVNAPYDITNAWHYRKDAFSEYKAGFEIRTTRLCQRVLLFHHFSELLGGSALVKSIDFEYDTSSEEDFTYLKSITSFGYIKKTNGSYSHKSLPSVEFEYQAHDWNKEIKTIAAEDMVHSPTGLDESSYQFTDFYNEGLSGILTEQGEGWYYKHNLSDGKFSRATLVSPKPVFAGIGSKLQLMDLDADGSKQIVSLASEPKGYFELDEEEAWQPFRIFNELPNIDMGDRNTRMLDLNGDGKPDILVTEDHVFTWYESLGRRGFSSANKTVKSFDEENGPHILFSESTQTIFLADMSGDGLMDIVRIRNGEICYWPNLGYGKFGRKVGMDHAPVFDSPASFNPSYLRLADINGSGTTDIIYLGKNKFSCWINLNGNAFTTTPFEIETFPGIHNEAKIAVTDLLGNGTICIVWSSNLSRDAQAPWKYIDLMNSRKPHLMVSYKNNLGKEVLLEYTPSTRFYIEDKLAGKPWVTKLHFPVQCIAKTETRDNVSGLRFISSYKYHHGYYDHAEREFRGFCMVEQTDAEHFEHWVKGNANNIVERELHQDPITTKMWFHTGAFLSREKILRQYTHEYWYEEMERAGFPVVNPEEPLPDARLITATGLDASIIDHLGAQEWQEALRACKSMALRSEVFANDAPLTGANPDQIQKALTPFSVAEHNYVIELLQPKGNNRHAVFAVKESEVIAYNYERNPEDPRIAHNLNIKLDEYGNVLESAAVVYPRMMTDASLPIDMQQLQNRATIIYTQNHYTNDVINDHDYRLRVPSEIKTYELKGVAKTNRYYTISDFDTILTGSTEVAYHQTTIDPAPGTSQKRLIEHIRNIFYRNDLSGALPLHQLESRGVPFESYQLAYTPSLITDVFGTRVNAALMLEGGFTHSEGDDNWWVRSGSRQFIGVTETVIDAQNRFYTPISYTDPFGARTTVNFYSNYFLFIEETEDELGNRNRVEQFDFRSLAPIRMKDPNGNYSEVLVDGLGLVKASAVFGKGNEADDLIGLNEFFSPAENTLINDFFNAPASDQLVTYGKSLLQHATARFVYDFDAYKNSGKPVVVATILREEHFQQNNDSPVQISFEYYNGSRQVVMRKTQAEPGVAKQMTIHPDETYSIVEVDTAASEPKQLRWTGSGRTVLNNKGNVVKQYEPYFSLTFQYEDVKELVESGVTPIMYYDALGRIFKTEMPDGAFSRTDFNAWKQSNHDPNDTVMDTDWYHYRTNRLIDAELIAAGKDPGKEKIAADKAAKHHDTPTILHVDAQGRPVLRIEHNKDVTDTDIYYHTKTRLDSEGNLLSVTDARGNEVMAYKYDMRGNKVYQQSMDTGQRWLLSNVFGDPLRTWDERNHEFQYFYDILHRPTISKVVGGDGVTPMDHIFDRNFYGETEPGPELKNLRGQLVKRYDTAGLIDIPEYDFKGQPRSVSRKLFRHYKAVANWTDAHLVTDLETDVYTFITETDALGRMKRQTVPDGSIITPSYNETGLLKGETVEHADPALATTYIRNIVYNEKRERELIEYGNGVVTRYYYDKETFRLNRLHTQRENNDPLQDLHYTYDPVGNITHIEDKNIPLVFFNNQKTMGVSTYAYDALYRLVEATGRENSAALSFNSQDNWHDAAFMHQLNPGDPMAVRNYTQTYQYDGAGNILQMQHQSAGNNWTKHYNYQTANNRLISTQIGATTYTYPHHLQHGYMTAMPHLEEMGWNFREELIKTIRQRRTDGGTPETTYYQYDGEGQRIRKITENPADAGNTPDKKVERITISGYEIYKKHSGSHAGLQRVSLNLQNNQHRFLLIETRNNVDDGTEKHLVRYQLHNHLGSACLELDNQAEVISYEEYHPFGTTAYQARNALISSAAKRFRYTGMERDEESGLEYHSTRYYLTWLGRWLNADPAGIEGGMNVYGYVGNNPLSAKDDTGQNATPPRTSSEEISQGRPAAPTLREALQRAPERETPLDLSPESGTAPATGSDTLDAILRGFAMVSRWIRNYLPGIIAAPLAGLVEILAGLTQLLGGLFTWSGSTALAGLRNMGFGALRIFGFREIAEERWLTGQEAGQEFGIRNLPTGLKMPESIARDMSITSERTDQITNNTAGRNGMHAWHASTNAILASRLGPVGAIFLFIAGLVHESPIDWDSFQAEQEWQGTVNHILDSFMDIIANIFGILIGLLIPRRWSVYVAAVVGNQIPGPGDPDPAFGGGGHRYNEGPRARDPRRAWGHYPPPIGEPNVTPP